MIAQLTGKVVSINLTEVVLDVNGVGYFVSIPMSTYDVLPKEGGTATLLTYLQVREDALQLFGFATKNEIEIFKLLITVNGIGAKTALAILSSMNISAFCNAIVNADMKALKHISGIGARSAERMVVELRDKIVKLFPELTFGSLPQDAPQSREMEDALLALEQLGFQRAKIQKTVSDLVAALPEQERSSENIIRKALRELNR
ncbi:MAG: Holliday junction branch migration protein RuvA [Lentisphaeria bacterium]|jgi:Holliday junction DNA helicase RuvA|nr:Holliday junction branch migration protein RuvA [Lentisphaeria bacterium]